MEREGIVPQSVVETALLLLTLSKPLLAILLLLPLSALAQTQVPNVFEDGTPASAAEVNENFQYVMENASGGGGCSATQQDNSVLIECADGTSGVIAGAGTVVIYPDGDIVGEAPDPVTLPTGDFVWQDANGVTITAYGDRVYNSIPLTDSAGRRARMFIDDDAQALFIIPLQIDRYYTEPDCSGTELILYPFFSDKYIFMVSDAFYVLASENISGSVMIQSRRLTKIFDGESWQVPDCVNETSIYNNLTFRQKIQYQPPEEWVNAVYPLSIVQLP